MDKITDNSANKKRDEFDQDRIGGFEICKKQSYKK